MVFTIGMCLSIMACHSDVQQRITLGEVKWHGARIGISKKIIFLAGENIYSNVHTILK